MQGLHIVSRPIPAAAEASSAHRQPQHEDGNLAAAAGAPQALADRAHGGRHILLEPGRFLCLRAHSLRQALTDDLPSCCGRLTQLFVYVKAH